jgi:hypothetical protein
VRKIRGSGHKPQGFIRAKKVQDPHPALAAFVLNGLHLAGRAHPSRLVSKAPNHDGTRNRKGKGRQGDVGRHPLFLLPLPTGSRKGQPAVFCGPQQAPRQRNLSKIRCRQHADAQVRGLPGAFRHFFQRFP